MKKLLLTALILVLILLTACSTTSITRCVDACIEHVKENNISLDASKCQYTCEDTRLKGGKQALEELITIYNTNSS
jgi:hypothetical protein